MELYTSPTDRDGPMAEQAPRSLKLTALPNRVRVLPAGPVGSEFDPGRDCSLTHAEVNSQSNNSDLHQQPIHHGPTDWPTISVMPLVGTSRYPTSGIETSGAYSQGFPAQNGKDIVWNWKPRDGLVFPEGMDDALQIIPELGGAPARPPRGSKPTRDPPTISLRPSRPPPAIGATGLPQLFQTPPSSQPASYSGMMLHNHSYIQNQHNLVSLISRSDNDPIIGHSEPSLNFPLERSNLTLLHESSIYEPASISKDSAPFCAGTGDDLGTADEHGQLDDLTPHTRTRIEAGMNNMHQSGYPGSSSNPGAPEANCFCCCFTTFCLVMSILLLTASAVLAIIHGAEVYRRKMATLDPDTFFYTLPDRRTGDLAASATEETISPSCEPYVVEPCIPHLPHNYTGYPNLVGHNSSKDLSRDLRMFREVMDGECYPLAGLIICHLLQPHCDPETHQKMDAPCREFCEHFLHRCDAFIPDRIRSRINCYHLTSDNCISRPPCSAELLALQEDEKICDGTVDCADRSDEKDCPTTAPPPNSSTIDYQANSGLAPFSAGFR